PSSIPTSSDEARALPTNVSTRATAATIKGLISTTDEARALAGYSLPISITAAPVSKAVTSTDEALAGGDVQIERPEGSRAVASRGRALTDRGLALFGFQLVSPTSSCAAA